MLLRGNKTKKSETSWSECQASGVMPYMWCSGLQQSLRQCSLPEHASPHSLKQWQCSVCQVLGARLTLP